MCKRNIKVSEDKLVVLFHGGLGNQLYQYAFYRWLQEEFPSKKVLADISEYVVNDCHQGFELLKIFPKLKLDIVKNYELFCIYGQIPRVYGGWGKEIVEEKIRKSINNLFFPIREENLYEEIGTESGHIKEEIQNGKKYLSGYWQNSFYFQRNKNLLLEELEFQNSTRKENIEIIRRIQESNAVSIHVRRGDYIAGGWPLLQESYYQKAVEIIRKYVENPCFFIFSDDMDYVQKNFEWLDNKIYITNNIGKDSYVDMQLMSLCKYNIIANSTFSIWAAMLNRCKDNIVIYPSEIENSKQVFSTWIQVES